MKPTHTIRIADLEPGDHLCCLYEMEEEHQAVLTPFLRQGLERGEKALYIVDVRTAESILGYLWGDGLEVEPYLESGQLSILTADDAYMQDGVFDPDGRIAFLRTEMEQALVEGYPALRITDEMTWALRGLPGSEQLIEYEARLNEFFPGSKCLAMCQYDQRRFDPALLLDALRTHPIAVVGTEFYENFYYIPPTEFLGEDLPAATLRHWLESLAERKRAEEEIRKLNQFLDSVIDNANVWVDVLDRKANVVLWNKAAEEISGYFREEVVGHGKIWEWLYPDREYRNEIVTGALAIIEKGGEEKEAETTIRRKDGQTRVISWNSRNLVDEKDNPIGSIALGRDITERRRLERRTEERRLYLESVLACAPDAIVTMDAQHRILEWNPGAERLFGYTLEEAVGRNVDELVTGSDPHTFGEATGFTRRVLAGESISPTETVRYRKDGTPVNVIVSGSPIWIGDELIGVVVVYTDITERKQLEAQLRQAQKMEAIGQLSGGIAHDFNNLLTTIGGFAELMLRKTPEGNQQHRDLRQIKIAAERAADLTRQLRLFTRQEEGERRPVQLNSVVEETHDLLERSISKGITIQLQLEPDLWAVEADPSQMSQVLMNLCVNAWDAMPDGGTLTLETRNMTLDEEGAQAILAARPGRYVCLSVSDTGCGMSPEVQARLFEPFFTTKDPGKGTGLGLAVVYGIVKGHGGFINVYSEEGKGSTFRIYLPVIELAVEERRVEVLELPTGTGTILLVDDEEAIRKLGERILKQCGYTVLEAENGVQALEVYQAHRGEIALVVLDMVMPEMGGRECLRRLRELDPKVKVLISTGYTVNGSVRELMSEGALGVVDKPFNIKDLASMVWAALDR
jgi:two-component system cell cycle sensor histidine kinase/response regulator CckA